MTKQFFVADLIETIGQILSGGGTFLLTVKGNSMKPLLTHERDEVVLGAPDHLQKGDVVLYKRSDTSYALHRIISLTNTGYIIMGDHTDYRELVSYDSIVAKAISFNRKGKSISTTDFNYKIYCILLKGIRPIRLVIGKMRRLCQPNS